MTHDTLFLGQDHRVLRDTKLGHERLSAWDQDVIRWRQWAVRNARGYASDQSSLTSVTVPTANAQDASTDRESAEVTGLALAAGAVEAQSKAFHRHGHTDVARGKRGAYCLMLVRLAQPRPSDARLGASGGAALSARAQRRRR